MIQNGKIYLWTASLIALTVVIVFGSLAMTGCSHKNSQTQKVYTIGILSGLDFFADTASGFQEEMTKLGYIEGKNVVYDVQRTNFDPEQENKILKNFVDDKVDLIFVFPTEASLEAKNITQGTGIPMVFANANIEGVNLVDSVSHPGGNITGVRYPGPSLALKRFEILHELMPQAKRILIAYQRGYPIVESQLEVLRPAAKALNITLLEISGSNAKELQTELDLMDASNDTADVDAILTIAEPLCVTPDAFEVLGKFAAKHDIQIGGALMISNDYRSIFGVSTDNKAVGKQAALLADKILKGTPAGTIMVASAENFIQINYNLTQELKLNVSEDLLAQANEIIR